jgi:hypothetical protein
MHMKALHKSRFPPDRSNFKPTLYARIDSDSVSAMRFTWQPTKNSATAALDLKATYYLGEKAKSRQNAEATQIDVADVDTGNKYEAVATVLKGYTVTVFEHDNNDAADSDSSDAESKLKYRHLRGTAYRAAPVNSEGYEVHDEGHRCDNGRYDDETEEGHRGDNGGHDDETDEERHHNEADDEEIPIGRALSESMICHPKPNRTPLNQHAWNERLCDPDFYASTLVTK